MDELTIGDKIYISSKQAAKITGYAKDYVGQLCREGRVDARLVGRNWYVLESSIREHRFGAESRPEIPTSSVEAAPVAPTRSWEPPTYAAVAEETLLPPLVTPEKPPMGPETAEAVALMQDAWKEWFAAREGMITPVEPEEETPIETSVEEVEVEVIETEPSPTVEVRTSDITSNYNVSEVSQVEEESRIPVRRIEEVEVEEMEVEVTPTYVPRTIPAPVAHRAPGSVIDLSRVSTAREEIPYEPIIHSERIVRRRRVSAGKSNVIVQSILISVAGLAIVVAVIGSGALESLSSTQAVNESLRGAIFDALRGETKIEK